MAITVREIYERMPDEDYPTICIADWMRTAYLCVWADTADGIHYYLAVPVGIKTVAAIRGARITFREVLERAEVYIWMGTDGSISAAAIVRTPFDELEDYIPPNVSYVESIELVTMIWGEE